ncbi:MAG: ferritin family protein [Candidatus Lindowbacteria bacterium]|nr:ferritin family protein [Candidatus Lindowbacteria bacterium]
MKVDFNGDEIKIYDFDELEAYRIARKIEEDGIYYYSRMKEEVLRPEIRDVVEMLIKDERNHLALFEKKIEEVAQEQEVVDEGETLADIVDSKVMDVLSDSERVADVLCNPQEALRLGMSVEKRSIAFYSEILQSTQDITGKAALEKIITQERDHLKKLEALVRK